MDLELLRTFLELNRTRHFKRAAESLSLTQAAISSRLKVLESLLGCTLFDRSRREVRLTPEGGRLVPHAEKILAQWRAARQDVSMAQSAGQIVIGGSLRLWDVLLQHWLHDLRSTHPELAIIAESQSTDVLTRRLIDGSLDVAILLEPAQLDSMHIKPVATLEIVCVSTEKDMSLGAALGKGYVYVDWGLSFGLEHRRAFPDAAESMTRVSHGKIAMEYLIARGGSAFLPYSMIRGSLSAGTLHRVADAPVFRRQAYAAYPVRSPRLTLIEACVQQLAAAA